MSDLVSYAVADGVATVALDNPATRNALSNAMLDALFAALEKAKADDSVRVVVLTSADDRVFSAGGDLKAFVDDAPLIDKYGELDRFPRLYRLMGALGKPVICAANADVLAGAVGLALACDLILAKESISFRCPEINVGVFPFMISALIYRNVPRHRATEMMMLGDPVSAGEAAALGMINLAVPDQEFDDVVAAWAQRLAAKSPLLMKMGKDAIDASRDLEFGAALDAMQSQLALALSTEDVREGVAAFREKREPQWRMR